MCLKLDFDEDFNDGLKRRMVEQCRSVVDAVRQADDDDKRHQAVHDIRKSLKRIRACLRLVRDHIDNYRELNVLFRDLARPISEIRDATANIETLDKLTAQYADALREDAFESIRAGLIARRAALAERDFHRKDLLATIRLELDAKSGEIPGWPWQVRGFDDIRPSVKRVYRRGRKKFRRSRDGGSAHDFHQWRKRVKYLRYQLDVLNRLWPEAMTTLESELHTLSDDLGVLHDLDVLHAAIADLDLVFDSEDEAQLFKALAGREQQRLTESALLQGSRCYRASPDEFCDMLADYWASWEAAA